MLCVAHQFGADWCHSYYFNSLTLHHLHTEHGHNGEGCRVPRVWRACDGVSPNWRRGGYGQGGRQGERILK